MSSEKAPAVFENFKIRGYDVKAENRYFYFVDVVGALICSINPRDYWFEIKIPVKTEDGLSHEDIAFIESMVRPMEANDG